VPWPAITLTSGEELAGLPGGLPAADVATLAVDEAQVRILRRALDFPASVAS
jgi:hypothetical protein